MAQTEAVVLKDGEVVSQNFMDRYAVKDSDKSGQIPADAFSESYGSYNIVEPLYNIEAIAQMMELNTYHYRAVKTKARDIAGLGWRLEPTNDDAKDGNKETLEEFLNNCHPYLSFTELIERAMVDQGATGDSYIEIVRDDDGYVSGLNHVPVHTVRIHRDMRRYVQQRGGKRAWFKRFGEEKDIDRSTGQLKDSVSEENRGTELMHLQNYNPRSDYYGLADVVPAMGSVLGDRKRQEYNISFFDNHAIPAYAVTVTGAELDGETKGQIKQFFQHEVKNHNHSTLVLTAKKDESDPDAQPVEFKFEALATEVTEASFTTFREQNRDEVLSAHGVPPYRAGVVVEGKLSGSSASESTEIYKQSVVRPRQEEIEQRINRFIVADGLDIDDWKFKFGEIDTRDHQAEIDRLQKLFEMGAYSPNDVLEALGEDRVEDEEMDKHYIKGSPLGEDSGGEGMFNSVKQLHADLVKAATKKS